MPSRFPLFSLITIIAFGVAVEPCVVLAVDKASQDQLQKVETELALQKKQAADLDRKKKETADTLQELRQKLIAATQALEDKEDEQQQVEDRLHGLENEIAAKNVALAKSRKELAALADVLIRLGQQPPET